MLKGDFLIIIRLPLNFLVEDRNWVQTNGVQPGSCYHPDQTPMPHKERPIAISWKENCSLNAAELISEQPDGERHWFKAKQSPLRYGNGDIIDGIYMLIDVFKQKRVD